MITEEQLDAAVSKGIIDQSTASALKAHAQGDASLPSVVDEEHFRLVSGFNDIFVVIAFVLLFASLSWMTERPVSNVLTAIFAWGLAEFFVLKRKMALPAIVLLIYFVASVFNGVVGLMDSNVKLLMAGDGYGLVIASVVTIVAAWLHWQRFKVPITVSAGVAFVVAAFLSLILSFTKDFGIIMPLASLSGVAVFLFAMYWDSADTKRETGKSDVAFWLHLSAAPMIIHPVFWMLGVTSGKTTMFEGGIVLALYLLIAVVSLLIDRRALMVSALGYVIYVFSQLLSTVGSGGNFVKMVFVISAALLLLSALWHKCRQWLLKFVPPNLKRYLPE